VVDLSENNSNDNDVYGLRDRTYFQPIQYDINRFISLSLELKAKQEVWIERAEQGYKV
jgi:hypothetical protein